MQSSADGHPRDCRPAHLRDSETSNLQLETALTEQGGDRSANANPAFEDSRDGVSSFASAQNEEIRHSSSRPSSRPSSKARTPKTKGTNGGSLTLSPASSTLRDTSSREEQLHGIRRGLGNHDGSQSGRALSTVQETGKNFRHRLNSTVHFGSTTFREISGATRSLVERYADCVAQVACGLGVTAAIVLCLILYLVADNQRTTSRPALLRRCEKHACEVARLDLGQLLDDAVDPCQDLHGHVCRKWAAGSAPLATGMDTFAGKNYLSASRDEFLRYLNSTLMAATGNGNASSSLLQVAQFYSYCIRFTSAAADGVSSSMAETVKSFRTEAESAVEATNFVSIMKRIFTLSILHGVHTFLGAQLVVCSDGITRLRLFPGMTLGRKLGETPQSEDVQEYLSIVFEQAEKMMPAETGFNVTLDEVLNIDHAVYYPRPSLHSPVERRAISVLGALCHGSRTYRWIRLINTHVVSSEDKLDYKSEAFSDQWDALNNILRYTYLKSSVGDLLAISVYLYLHVLVDALRLDFHRRRGFRSPERLVEVCLRTTHSAVAYARSVWDKKLLDESSSRGGADTAVVFPPLLKLFANAVQECTSGVCKSLRKAIESIASRVHLHSSEKPHQDESTLLRTLFPLRAAVPNMTFTKLSQFPLTYAKFRSARAMAYLATPQSELDREADKAFLGESVVYVDRLGLVFVPGYLSRRPVLYSKEVPLEFSMGSWAFLVARQLYRAAVDLSLHSGVLRHSEIVSVQNFEQCLKAFTSRLTNSSAAAYRRDHDGREATSLPSTTPEEATTHAWGELFLTSRGLALAHGALKDALEPYQSASNWHEYWMDAQRTFFVRYCLMSCAASTVPGHLDPKAHCTLPLATMDEFSDAFNCSNDGSERAPCALE
ncbi:uncharacterized protein LOC142560393 [Dermacentor variabilis]|uniref:uncharacterized protein LOC142560393 n=1 Tax=Dermacentor variabilis TaxID=34621 RepID=UPI003F5B19A0